MISNPSNISPVLYTPIIPTPKHKRRKSKINIMENPKCPFYWNIHPMVLNDKSCYRTSEGNKISITQ